jgi:predicted amidohydrolase
MSHTIRASVVQTCTASYSLPATLDKLERLTRLARDRDGTQLALFPEALYVDLICCNWLIKRFPTLLSIGGYPKMSTFGVVVGERSPEGRDEFLRYHSAAIDIPSPAISRMESISKDTGVFLVVGVVERDGGTLYCTVVFIDPQKGYLGKHRKLVPTAMERLIWGQGDGSTLPVLEKQFKSSKDDETIVEAKISAAICW